MGAAFWIDRVVLGALTQTPIYPPVTATIVTIQNATADDVQVHSDPDPAKNHYVSISPGFERPFQTGRTAYTPDVGRTNPAFWLNAVQDGTVILIWA